MTARTAMPMIFASVSGSVYGSYCTQLPVFIVLVHFPLEECQGIPFQAEGANHFVSSE